MENRDLAILINVSTEASVLIKTKKYIKVNYIMQMKQYSPKMKKK